MSEESLQFIYTISCKDLNGTTLLKNAFKHKIDAIEYVIKKLDTLLQIISDEYKKSIVKILPIHSSIIYTMYQMKNDNIEKYDYFLDNYKNFYRGVSRDPLMFFVSKHTLI